MEPNTPTDYRALSADTLLDLLEHAGWTPDLDLLRACLERPAELTPALLARLAQLDDPAWLDDDPRLMAKIHAGRLLITYREPAALPVFAQLYRASDTVDEGIDELFNPALPSYGPAVLPALIDLLGDPQVPDANQCSVIEILVTVATRHPETHATVVERLRSLLPPLDPHTNVPQIRQEQFDDPPDVWTWATQGLADLRDLQSIEHIRALFERDLIDPWLIGEQDYLRHMNRPHSSTSFLLVPEQPFDLLRLYEQQQHQDAGYERLAKKDQRWEQQLSITEKILSAGKTAPRADKPQPSPFLPLPTPQTPVTRATPKVGRNEPCPCGSGRKYKHCHGK